MELDIEKVRRKQHHNRTNITLRIDNEILKWISEEKLRPTAIFIEACRVLGCPYLQENKKGRGE